MSTLKMTFINNSIQKDANVSIGFVSGSSTALFSIATIGTPSTAILNLNSEIGNGNWYSLSDLSSGVNIQNFSGRIYVAYGDTWTVPVAGYEPAQNITDVNFFLRYDKMELTFNGAAADVGDLTSIDFWSIPMQLNTTLKGIPVQSDNGFKTGVTSQMVFDTLNNLTTPTVSGLPNALPALVPGLFTQDPKTQLGSGFARIIGPSSYPPIGGVPITPYNTFESYLTHLYTTFGPSTKLGAVVPGLGKGIIAQISGEFNGVTTPAAPGQPAPPPPSTGPQSKQSYNLVASIDTMQIDATNIAASNIQGPIYITLKGTVGSYTGTTTMIYQNSDLINPDGIYGANAPYTLNGGAPTNPVNDVYGWIAGDLFAGLNIGAIGSTTEIGGTRVGAMTSTDWFSKIPNTSLFSNLQSSLGYYNQFADALQGLSDAYNFAYSDRFSAVQISVNPATTDTLILTLLDDTMKM